MSGLQKKKQKIIKKFRICVLGPSYVGKTQIVNRLVNNQFSGFYEPTISKQINRIAYNLHSDEPDREPEYFDLEIIDLFPHDHPYLDIEQALMDEAALAMSKELDRNLQSPYDTNMTMTERIDQGVQGYIFVYDSSNRRTFQSMQGMLETVTDLEESKKKSGGLKSGSNLGSKSKMQPKYYFPKKIVVGNKKDLAKNRQAGSITHEDIKKIEGIKIKEVSALTN